DPPRGTYWKSWLQYVNDHLLRRDLISAEDLSLFKTTTSVAEAVEEITDFYRVYHSSRYVGRRWVARLTRPVPQALCDALARDFAPLIGEGGIVQRDAPPEEHEAEADLDHLPRLVFIATRIHFGHLRQLIAPLKRDGCTAGARHP